MTPIINRRAQLSLEFVFIMAFALLMLIVLLIVAGTQLTDSFDRSALAGMADTTAAIQRELVTATSVRDGYVRAFTLPNNIHGTSYSLVNSIDGNRSVITMRLSARQMSIFTPACNGNLTAGTNTIRKTNGTLWCNS